MGKNIHWKFVSKQHKENEKIAENQNYFLSTFHHRTRKNENYRKLASEKASMTPFYKPKKSRDVIGPVVGEHHQEETNGDQNNST